MRQREIKFRIWDKLKNCWYRDNTQAVHLFGGNILMGLLDTRQDSLYVKLLELDNLIEMQYTGIKDKNGLEIYEGDIVKTDENHFCRCDSDWVEYKKGEVMWINAGFKVCEELIGANDLSIYSMCNCGPSCPSGLIIIGNIYEGIKEDENYK